MDRQHASGCATGTKFTLYLCTSTQLYCVKDAVLYCLLIPKTAVWIYSFDISTPFIHPADICRYSST
eukprot:SAG31_NODE_39542_length_287_cov_1.074468_1_plen_66_part_10